MRRSKWHFAAGWGTCWDKDLSLEGGEENTRRRAGGLGGTAPGLKATAKGAPVRREQRASRRIRRQLIRRLEMRLAARGTAAQATAPKPRFCVRMSVTRREQDMVSDISATRLALS